MKYFFLAFAFLAFVPLSLSAQVAGNTCVQLSNDLYIRVSDAETKGEVTKLQKFLYPTYLSDAPTGYFGSMTLIAVERFQKENGIKVTGYAGITTREKIKALSCNTAKSTQAQKTTTGKSFLAASAASTLSVNANTPSSPSSVSVFCPIPGDSAMVSWPKVAGATNYLLRVDNTENPWSGNCTSPNAGDYCADLSVNTKVLAGVPGANYDVWVHACNKAGCSAPMTIQSFCAKK